MDVSQVWIRPHGGIIVEAIIKCTLEVCHGLQKKGLIMEKMCEMKSALHPGAVCKMTYLNLHPANLSMEWRVRKPLISLTRWAGPLCGLCRGSIIIGTLGTACSQLYTQPYTQPYTPVDDWASLPNSAISGIRRVAGKLVMSLTAYGTLVVPIAAFYALKTHRDAPPLFLLASPTVAK